MNPRCIPVLVALLAASLSAFAAEPDGRPVVLVIGDNNASPHGSSPGWPALIAKANPTWDVRSVSDPKQTITSVAANIDTILAAQPPLSSVILFLGTQDAAAENYAKVDAKAAAESMSKIIKAIKANPNSKSATITLSTAMPVINARLDQWSKEKYKDSEQHSDAIADALRTVATAENTPLLDTHKWAKDDAQDGKAGRLLGSIGWQVRDWGMPAIAAHVGDFLKKNEPKPLDAAKFANWQKEFAANQQLETILASTSEGLVSVTGEYPGKLVPEKPAYYIIELPPELIAGQTLNVLFKAGDKPHAAIGNAGNRPFAHTTLIVTAGDAEAKIPLKAADWQTIDEATPDRAVDASRYRFNMQKMNYFGIASSEAGARRWVLARFDLSPLAGKKNQRRQIQHRSRRRHGSIRSPRQSHALPP